MYDTCQEVEYKVRKVQKRREYESEREEQQMKTDSRLDSNRMERRDDTV